MNVQDAYEHLPVTLKIGLDMTSLGVMIGTIVEHLPAAAAALSVVWSLIRIYETKTVGRWLGRTNDNPSNID